MKKYLDTFLLFGSLGLIVIWVDQFIYKGVDLKDCYFWLMFAIAGFLTYLFRRGQKKIDADKEKESPKKSMENRLKANYGKKKKK